MRHPTAAFVGLAPLGAATRLMFRRLGLLGAALCLAPAVALACPGEGYCEVDGGRYAIALPEGDGPYPALLYLHGWGNSPGGVVDGRGPMLEAATARGYAVILPEGLARDGRRQRDWAVEDGGEHPRDDLAFFEAVLDDAAGRHGIDRAQVLMAGFSRGGSMVWDAACARPDLARAYAPVAGAFWAPMPKRCEGAVELRHVHGWDDGVVPLEGRPIGSRLVQGDVFRALAILRETNGCRARQPDERVTAPGAWTRAWTACEAGSLDLALHPGGHVLPTGWAEETLDWFERRLGTARR
ncbi:MAG: alpha/beta hydrolase family esterase [Paracoccaceae bacterium]